MPDVEQAWDYYHGLLQEIRQNQTDQALLLDIHGHGHPTVWVELGYLVSRTRLNLGKETELIKGVCVRVVCYLGMYSRTCVIGSC